MTHHESPLARRYALRVSLLYLLIRGLPELFTWAWMVLPDWARQGIIEGPWVGLLRHLPPRPLELAQAVPPDFLYGLNSLAPLVIEVLLVFIFSLWMLKRRGATPARGTARKPAMVLIVAILLWPLVFRYVLLTQFIDWQFMQLGLGESDFEQIIAQVFRSYWVGLPVFYLSTILWAGLPVWLHFKALGRPVAATSEGGVTGPAWKQASVTANFMLGFLLLHYAAVQGGWMGLWPWLVDQRDIFIPMELQEEMVWPLLISQLLLPTLAAWGAAVLYGRNGHFRPARYWPMGLQPLLVGMLAWLLTNVICLILLWLLFYFAYDLAVGIPLGLAYQPELANIVLVVLNLVILGLLCAVTVFLRGPRQRPATGPDVPGAATA